jgi:hypothetical protein
MLTLGLISKDRGDTAKKFPSKFHGSSWRLFSLGVSKARLKATQNFENGAEKGILLYFQWFV